MLVYPTRLDAGAYPVREGKTNIILDFTWAKSDGAFNAQGDRIALSRKACSNPYHPDLIYCSETYLKQEGKLFIEYGAWSRLTLIGEIEGGKQKAFQLRVKRHWLNAHTGFRLNFYEGDIVISIENSYGYAYQRQNINITQNQHRHGAFLRLALLLGGDWRIDNWINSYITTSYGWKRNWNQTIEADYLFGETTIGIELLETSLWHKLILLNDVLIRRGISGDRRFRGMEYVYQGSLVIFPVERFGVQLGYRFILSGRNVEASEGGFAKLWFAF